MLDNEFWGFDNADLCWKSSMKEIRFTIIGTDGWRKQTNACSSQRSMRNFSLKMFAGAESSVFVAIRRTAWRTLCKWHQHSLVHPLKLLDFLLFNFTYFLLMCLPLFLLMKKWTVIFPSKDCSDSVCLTFMHFHALAKQSQETHWNMFHIWTPDGI